MALVPIVTDITAHVSSWDAAGIIDAIRDHINVTSGASHLTIDAYTLNEGLTVGFKAAGEDQQVNLRSNGGTNIAPSIEPSGSITDPGDSSPTAPTGTSADWSGEPENQAGSTQYYWDVTDATIGSVGAGSKVWCIEMPDAFTVWITDSTNTHQVNGCHAGRIYAPFNSADAVAAGQDGLGLMSGKTSASNGSIDDWINNQIGPTRCHWATGEWGGFELEFTPSSSYTAPASDVTYRPLPPIPMACNSVNGSNSDPMVGVTKYLRMPETSEIAFTVIPDAASNQGWIHVNENTSTSALLHIWDKTKTP